MPRANRYFLPGYVWHITHRCHKREFLLRFARDRSSWIGWLWEARKRFGLQVLNYMATSNHIHLLVIASDDMQSIPQAMQLVAGRAGQEYNQRKARKGAFWQDRYHATAVATDEHLVRCLVYIDTNMVRAGAVSHPREWPHCGYHEILDPPKRYKLIDRQALTGLLGVRDSLSFSDRYALWVEEAVRAGGKSREGKWSDSIAVGNREFVEEIKRKLGMRAVGRRVVQRESFELREQAAPYVTSSHNQFDNRLRWQAL